MNAGQVFGLLCCLGVALGLVLGFEVVLFRAACNLCRVPRPGLPRMSGVVLTMLVVPAAVDGVFGGVLYEVYTATGYPLWEAGVVQFFLALPVHMAICSTIHAAMVRVRVSQGVAVWLVEKVLKFGILAAIAGVAAVFVLAARANG